MKQLMDQDVIWPQTFQKEMKISSSSFSKKKSICPFCAFKKFQKERVDNLLRTLSITTRQMTHLINIVLLLHTHYAFRACDSILKTRTRQFSNELLSNPRRCRPILQSLEDLCNSFLCDFVENVSLVKVVIKNWGYANRCTQTSNT